MTATPLISPPLISIVIPTYNQADWLREALDSVMAQDFTDWEAIVINNFSDDHTEEVVRSFADPRVQLVNFANHGIIAASRNVGIRAAKGEWVAFLDSDDIWHGDKLSTCVARMASDIDIVTHGVHFYCDGKVLRDWHPGPEARANIRNLLFEGSAMSPSATMVRRQLLEQVGGVSEDLALRTAEDYELQLKLVEAGARIRFLPLILSKYRIHPGQMSKSATRHMEATLLAVLTHYRLLPQRSACDVVRLRRRRATLLYGAGRLFQQAGEMVPAVRLILRALTTFPFLPKAFGALALALLSGRRCCPAKDPMAVEGRVRVVINGIHAKTGGGVTYLRNMLPHLAAIHDLELHLFLHESQYELFGEPPEGIQLHLFEFRTSFMRLLAWEQLALPFLARVMGAKTVFSPANYGPIFAPNPVILLRNSLAVLRREPRLSKQAYWIGLAIATLLSLATCRGAIAVSDYARRALGFRGLFGGKVKVVHHGVDPLFTYDPSVAEGDYVLAVSDIYVQKNLHGLIGAWQRVAKSHTDVTLKIVGRIVDVGYFDEIEQLVRKHGLGDRVQFLGARSPAKLRELYRSCRTFVFPSTVETFGNPLVEAMACGAPVASSNAAAMPEIVADGALLFDPMDVDDMAAKISHLLSEPEARRELRAKGVARAALYSWAETARRTADILRIAAGKGA
ncbi:MAG: glycosyltransferase [Rhodospirillaceae bacterium]|nr:glycosyltransferase [Rhodospirillales bacterium]